MEASSREWFSNPATEQAVSKTWESVLTGHAAEQLERNNLRKLIEGSWKRCLQAHVDPHTARGPEPLTEDQLLLHREHQQALLRASQPVIVHSNETMMALGTLIALTDSRSMILNTVGDPAALEAAQAIRLIPGVNWSEAHCGTNAIGTALITGHNVQIHSSEHFCEGIKPWTCSAAVIRHPLDGEIIGAIDVSGLSHTYSRQHLALAVSSAKHIESRLCSAEMELRYQLLDVALSRFSSLGADAGVILFDHRGNTVKANVHAQKALYDVGAGLNLAELQRLAELAVNPRASNSRVLPLPDWLRAEWIEPVMAGGQRLGTMLVLPKRPAVQMQPSVRAQRKATKAGFADPLANVVTGDAVMTELVEQARRLRNFTAPVLLLGETGVGKELFARGLHSQGPFVALNCGGLSRELLASELFGYADGAFTGARKGGSRGKIEAAEGGTLFLDEIGEMPLDMQAYLLRVLEEREVCRLGDNLPRSVNFRLIAATHRNLRQEIEAGRFRMDLYYRIAVVYMQIPPLRARNGDVALLARSFALGFQRQLGKATDGIEPDALGALEAYHWPGNVRELRNVIESAVLLSPGGALTRAMLLPYLHRETVSTSAAQALSTQAPISLGQGEADLIKRSIAANGGNLTQSARSLHIAKSTLYAKMKRYGMSREDALDTNASRNVGSFSRRQA